jgi:hypothetical protein
VQHFRDTGDKRVFRELIDKRVAASMRNVDALFRLGINRKLDDGGLELQKRTIDGVTYSLRAWSNGDRTVRVALHHPPAVAPDQILRYHFTLDDWKNRREVSGKIIDGRAVFDIDVEPSHVGRIEGVFHRVGGDDFWVHHSTPYRNDDNFRGYVFAAPDAEELERLAQNL